MRLFEYNGRMEASLLFEALADDTRRRILILLLEREELCVCDLYSALELTQPKVSRHLALLREAGLVAVRRQGTWMHYRLAPDLPLWRAKILQQMADGLALTETVRSDRRRLRQFLESKARCA
jgi:ArsR family transcriptional regulator